MFHIINLIIVAAIRSKPDTIMIVAPTNLISLRCLIFSESLPANIEPTIIGADKPNANRNIADAPRMHAVMLLFPRVEKAELSIIPSNVPATQPMLTAEPKIKKLVTSPVFGRHLFGLHPYFLSIFLNTPIPKIKNIRPIKKYENKLRFADISLKKTVLLTVKLRKPIMPPKTVKTRIRGMLKIMEYRSASFQFIFFEAIYESMPGAHTMEQTLLPLASPAISIAPRIRKISISINYPPGYYVFPNILKTQKTILFYASK